RTYLIPYRVTEGGCEVRQSHELDHETGTAIAALRPRSSILQLQESTQRFGIAEARAHAQVLLQSGDEGQTLRGACQWLFDSYAEQSDLLAFVQATVAIEMALGEKAASDLIGVGELLGNRCAYLIGKSRKRRADILKVFKRLY